MKLQQTQDYLLLIDEEAEINTLDAVINLHNNELHFALEECLHKDNNCKKVIAYYPLTKEAKELDLPLLPRPVNNCNPFLNGKITKATCYTDSGTFYFEDLERLFKSKQFSLEDMYRVAIAVANKVSRPEYGEIININEIVDTYIQSLSTQQLPKEFIMKKEPIYEEKYVSEMSAYMPYCIGEKPWIITNSEGKEELVGTYKY